MSTYGSLKSNWHAIKVSTAAHSDCPLVLCSAKHSFVKVAARRTVHLQQCSLRQLRLLSLLFQLKFMGSPLSLCLSLVSLHPSLCVFCFHYSFSLCFSIYILSLCLPVTLSPFYCLVAIIFFQQLVQ